MSVLERSDELFRKMIDEVADYAILLMDKDGIILNWNKGAQNIKGYAAEEIVGKNFRTFYLPEDRKLNVPETLIAEATLTGRASAEGYRIRKDGSTFWGSIVITALHDDDNNVIGFTKVTRDLTERKLAEDKIRQYTADLEAQNKELAQYAYITSHDLQEPLRKIQTFSLLALEETNIETIHKYLEKINSSTGRMSSLIKGVLNFMRVSETEQQWETVDLNVVLKNILQDQEILIMEKKASVDIGVMPILRGVEIQLYQLFLNLIGNALKFSDRRPEISITSTTLASLEDFPNLDPTKKYCEIKVKDNGIGFDNQHSDRIFLLFKRLNTDVQRFPGTGLGLALCRKIVDNHKGHIHAVSTKGEGSEFCVVLPCP